LIPCRLLAFTATMGCPHGARIARRNSCRRGGACACACARSLLLLRGHGRTPHACSGVLRAQARRHISAIYPGSSGVAVVSAGWRRVGPGDRGRCAAKCAPIMMLLYELQTAARSHRNLLLALLVLELEGKHQPTVRLQPLAASSDDDDVATATA
jgi:hypothetical protein